MATIVVAVLAVGSSLSPAIALHAASRGEETDVESTSKLAGEFAPGRIESTCRPGRGKHRSATREVVPLHRLASFPSQFRAGADHAASGPVASEWDKRNGCGAFLQV